MRFCQSFMTELYRHIGISWGGSLVRPGATGFGTVIFTEEMLKTRGSSLTGSAWWCPAPWDVDATVALPCATQNELDDGAAARLVRNGLVAVGEGANMPSARGAVAVSQEAGMRTSTVSLETTCWALAA